MAGVPRGWRLLARILCHRRDRKFVLSDLEEDTARVRRRYRDLARDIERLEGPDHDAKLRDAITLVKGLTRDGHNPIVLG